MEWVTRVADGFLGVVEWSVPVVITVWNMCAVCVVWNLSVVCVAKAVSNVGAVVVGRVTSIVPHRQ